MQDVHLDVRHLADELHDVRDCEKFSSNVERQSTFRKEWPVRGDAVAIRSTVEAAWNHGCRRRLPPVAVLGDELHERASAPKNARLGHPIDPERTARFHPVLLRVSAQVTESKINISRRGQISWLPHHWQVASAPEQDIDFVSDGFRSSKQCWIVIVI